MSLLPEFQVLVCLTRSGVVIDGFAGSCHTGVFSCMEKESVFLLLYTSVISLLTLLIAEMFFLQFLLFKQEFSVRERRTVWIKGFLSMHLYVCPHMFEVWGKRYAWTWYNQHTLLLLVLFLLEDSQNNSSSSCYKFPLALNCHYNEEALLLTLTDIFISSRCKNYRALYSYLDRKAFLWCQSFVKL